MVQFTKLKESFIEQGKRILKVLGMGGAMTAKECMPFGFDGLPNSEYTAIYSKTSSVNERVVIGYINKNQLSEEGESRIYSIDKSGGLQAYVWNRSNGDLNLNGDEYTAVRYEPLNTSLQDTISQINANLALIATGISTAGGAYTPQNVSIDIETSKSEKVKIK